MDNNNPKLEKILTTIFSKLRHQAFFKYVQPDPTYMELVEKANQAEQKCIESGLTEDQVDLVEEMITKMCETSEHELCLTYIAGFSDCLLFLDEHGFLNNTDV